MIPWVPRLDLWYRAHKLAGTLPRQYQNASLMEITDDLPAGYHAVIPPFQDLRSRDDDIDRALGIYNLKTMCYKTTLENVNRKVRIEGDKTFVKYQTPLGDIETVVLYNDSMRRAGISITHILEYAVKSVGDLAPLGYIFENARVEPNYDSYLQFAQEIGDRGLAVAYVSLAASPVHLIQRELMPLDLFFYEMHDHPDEMQMLAEKITLYWNRLIDVATRSPAEILLLGANYDASVTYPPFFAEHIQPWLKKFAQELHQRDKYLLTHTDGENSGLLEHYLQSRIDIADSICPEPMTKLSFKEVRDFFAGKITIMGGIPSVTLLESSLTDKEFERFLDNFFDQISKGDHLILGISDTTPPAAKFERIVSIGQKVKQFGPVA